MSTSPRLMQLWNSVLKPVDGARQAELERTGKYHRNTSLLRLIKIEACVLLTHPGHRELKIMSGFQTPHWF